MLLHDREWEDCSECGRHKTLIREEEYGCDYCKKPFTDGCLEVTVFSRETSEDSKRYQFCSWMCCLKTTKKIKSDYFLELPMLSFDSVPKGRRAKDFWAAIKELGKKPPTR